jgi:hypothetical protein
VKGIDVLKLKICSFGKSKGSYLKMAAGRNM